MNAGLGMAIAVLVWALAASVIAVALAAVAVGMAMSARRRLKATGDELDAMYAVLSALLADAGLDGSAITALVADTGTGERARADP